ncbi:MAG: PD40 domain-containing protein [Anaerolineales bacterium]|nr:PD40 domain-containing protein [Anaerolineales bacterium]
MDAQALVWRGLIGLCFVVLVGCGAPVEELLFSSDQDGDAELFLLDLSDQTSRQLTENTVTDYAASWSPDGRQMAVSSDAGIVILDLEGQILAELAPEGRLANGPSWSPDGKSLVFYGTMAGNFEIYKADASLQNIVRLTNTADVDESCPLWSPDGEHIAFVGHPDTFGFHLYVMNSDGGEIEGPIFVWADTGFVCPAYAWSPDGQQLALASYGLYLTAAPNFALSDQLAACARGRPDWSPDGRLIVYAGDDCTRGEADIFVIGVDGSDQRKLTDDQFDDSKPVWSPAGDAVAFLANHDIYLINADGTDRRRLIADIATNHELSWRPLGR